MLVGIAIEVAVILVDGRTKAQLIETREKNEKKKHFQ